MSWKHNGSLLDNARYLRKNMTAEERKLWYDFLRTYPLLFLRQKIIGGYIADFYCAKAGLIVEIDGSQHYRDEAAEYDAARTEYFESLGLKVVRISNIEVNKNFRGVCEYIDEVVTELCSH